MATKWYLCPTDKGPVTNKYFALVIGEQNPECEKRNVLCHDGVRRNFYECPNGYNDVRAAIIAKLEYNLKFEVYKKDSEGVSAEEIVRYDLWKESAKRAARGRHRHLRSHRRLQTLKPQHR